MEARPGSMGRAMPGHEVAIVDESGQELPPGAQGIIAIRRPDPVMFLGYWNNPKATAEKFKGEWCLTGDVAVRDGDGYFWFKGRSDDLILSAGYRIGPAEVEDCLTAHPAVSQAGVIGVPDKLRGEAIKAYVVLGPGHAPSDDLKRDIQAHVRARLAAHEYPREIAFIDAMPMTTTGKIRRMDLRAL